MKAMKLDNKVKAINLCDGGKSCRAVANNYMLCFVCYLVPVVMLLLFTFIVDEIISLWYDLNKACDGGKSCRAVAKMCDGHT
jgi:hypothetical protein